MEEISVKTKISMNQRENLDPTVRNVIKAIKKGAFQENSNMMQRNVIPWSGILHE